MEEVIKETDVKPRLKEFARSFMEEFKLKLEEFTEEAKGKQKKTGTKIPLIGKFFGTLTGVEKIEAVGEEVGNYIGSKAHKKKAKRIIKALWPEDEQLESLLLRTGFAIFRSFESQFVQADDGAGWRVAMSIIAQDAVDRIMNGIDAYMKSHKEWAKHHGESKTHDSFLFNLVCISVLEGNSKGLLGSLLPVLSILFRGEKCTVSNIFENVGLVVVKNNDTYTYYNKKDNTNEAETCGYRKICVSNTEDVAILLEQYAEDENQNIRYKYTLHADDFAWLEREMSKLQENDNVTKKEQQKDTSEILEAIRNISLVKAPMPADRPIWFQTKKPIRYFTGRKQILKEIRDDMCTETIVVISGLSGIGKSELALKFASIEYGEGDSVIWINSETFKSMRNDYYRLHNKLGFTMKEEDEEELTIKTITEQVFDYFSKFKTLLIFDNATDFRKLRTFLPDGLSETRNLRILVTSKSAQWNDTRTDIKVKHLKDFKEEEAVIFLKEYLNIGKEADDCLNALVNKLHKFPLALHQVANFINYENELLKNTDPSITIQDYLRHFDKKTAELLNCSVYDNLDSDYGRTVYTTLQLILDEIKRAEREGELALKMLNMMAYLLPDAIPRMLFQCPHERDKLAYGSAIQLLKNRSILRDEETLHVHGLVQEIVRLNIRAKSVNGEQDVLKDILHRLKDDLNDKDIIGHVTCVWKYAYRSDDLIDQFIIKAFSNKQETNYLHLIVEGNKYDIIKHIIQRIEVISPGYLSRILNMKDENRGTVLHRGAARRDQRIVLFLLSKDAKQTTMRFGWNPLHIATKKGRLGTVKIFIENYPKCELRKTGYKFTCLHLAAKKDFPDIVAFLLSNHKIDVNAVTNDRFTALHFAVQNNNLEIVNMLLKHDSIDANVKTKNKSTPLHFTAREGSIDIVRALIASNKVDINAQERFNFTLLHFAAVKNYVDIVEILINNKALLNCTTTKGKTPLHLAAAEGHFEVVKLLLENNADIRALDNEGMAAEHLARDKQHVEVENYIKKFKEFKKLNS